MQILAQILRPMVEVLVTAKTAAADFGDGCFSISGPESDACSIPNPNTRGIGPYDSGTP